MSSINSNSIPTMPREDRKALIDKQLATIKTFTSNPNCTHTDLETISIHLAVLMVKVPAERHYTSSQLPDVAMPSGHHVRSNKTSTGKIDDSQKDERSRVRKTTLSATNGGSIPVVTKAERQVEKGKHKERRTKVKAPRLTEDEAATLGLFNNLSIRIKGKWKFVVDEMGRDEEQDPDLGSE